MRTVQLRAWIGARQVNSSMAAVFKDQGVQGVYTYQVFVLSIDDSAPVDVAKLCDQLRAALVESGLACRSVEPVSSDSPTNQSA